MAAAAEGISAETVRRWRQRYPAFAAQVEQARASCTVHLLRCLNKAALAGNWKAVAWLLERTRPASYGPPPRRVGLDVGLSVPDFSEMSDADLEAYAVKLGGPTALGLSGPGVTPLISLPAPQHSNTPGGRWPEEPDAMHPTPAGTHRAGRLRWRGYR
jgi:hypothetical protein